LIGNSISANFYGFYLRDSSDNAIYHNNLNNRWQTTTGDFSNNTWNDHYPSGGNYWSNYSGLDEKGGLCQNETGSDGIHDEPYIINQNNVDRYPLTKPYAGPNDIGILASVSKTVVAQGISITVRTDVKIVNYGIQEETFNFTFQIIRLFTELTIKLASRNSTTVVSLWPTTNSPKGNYVILAQVTSVSGEADTSDNTFSCAVYIGVPGDVDGNHIVNTLDLFKIASVFDATIGQPNYVSNFDVDDNCIINMPDLSLAAIHFGQTDP
jgi:parallel beta-helix repeat protein